MLEFIEGRTVTGVGPVSPVQLCGVTYETTIFTSTHPCRRPVDEGSVVPAPSRPVGD